MYKRIRDAVINLKMACFRWIATDFALPTKILWKNCVVLVKMKLKYKINTICFRLLCKDRLRLKMHPLIIICQLNILFRSPCSVTRKSQSKTFHISYFMCGKNAIFSLNIFYIYIVCFLFFNESIPTDNNTIFWGGEHSNK